MTFGFPKSPFPLLAGTALALSGCVTNSEKVSITKVNPYHLTTSVSPDTDDRMVEFEPRHYLHGALTLEEQADRYGYYFSVFWKTATRQSATVRLEYRQGASGSHVLSKELFIADPKRNNVTKFKIVGDDFEDGGKVTQWKASVIEDGVVVAEYRSFLWKE